MNCLLWSCEIASDGELVFEDVANAVEASVVAPEVAPEMAVTWRGDFAGGY